MKNQIFTFLITVLTIVTGITANAAPSELTYDCTYFHRGSELYDPDYRVSPFYLTVNMNSKKLTIQRKQSEKKISARFTVSAKGTANAESVLLGIVSAGSTVQLSKDMVAGQDGFTRITSGDNKEVSLCRVLKSGNID